jgi:hypothetical protein
MINLKPIGEFERMNAYRVHVGMPPLPDNDALNITIWMAGFRACFEKPYPVPTVVPR